jgi:adenylate cyclase
MLELINAIVAEGLEGNSLQELLDEACRGLGARGVPLWRSYAGMPLLDPTAYTRGVTWWRDAPTRTAVRGEPDDTEWRRSPFFPMVAERVVARSWDLTSDEEASCFELLRELRQLGGTQYLARLVHFGAAQGRADLRGLAISFATDRAGGFTSDDLAAIDAIVPLLGLAAFRVALLDLATSVVDAYVGRGAGRRVLDGAIRRGSGDILEAALLFADLRGFTALTERVGGLPVVDLLNAYFEAIADPVAERGGEVLKFMGDGVLAIFPIGDAGAEAACGAALAAGRDALDRAGALSAARVAAGEPVLDLDVALHMGEVVYGNVGAARRLDFTAIGSAVNVVCRIEKMCDLIGTHLVMSSRFAEVCGRATVCLGSFSLQGLSSETGLFGLPEHKPAVASSVG